MGRAPCCSKVGLQRGPWTTREDTLLINYIQAHGEGHWRSLPKKAGKLITSVFLIQLRSDLVRDGQISPAHVWTTRLFESRVSDFVVCIFV
jgi:hypothetical protein